MTPSPPERPESPADEPQDSILGSLPRTRPSVRSPRRDEAAKARARAKPAASKPKPRAAGPRRERPAARPENEGASDAEGAGVEDIARAGVTTAVQVATAGMRFAGRAAGAIRESLERR